MKTRRQRHYRQYFVFLLKALSIILVSYIFFLTILSEKQEDGEYKKSMAIGENPKLDRYQKEKLLLGKINGIGEHIDIKNKTLQKHFRSMKILNHSAITEGVQEIPNTLCGNKTLLGVLFVFSPPSHFKYRSLIRNTWGKSNHMALLNLKTVFVLGKAIDDNLQTAIDLESKSFQDVMQTNFLDNYRNLTYKVMFCIQFILNYCPKIKFAVKMDDNLFVNVHGLARYLRRISVTTKKGDKKSLYCHILEKKKVIRERKSIYYVTPDEFTGQFYPTYCSGCAYIMPENIFQILYDVSHIVPFFWLEDVYVTGMLANRANINHTDISSLYSSSYGSFTLQMMFREVLFGIFQYKDMYKLKQLWNETETIEATIQ